MNYPAASSYAPEMMPTQRGGQPMFYQEVIAEGLRTQRGAHSAQPTREHKARQPTPRQPATATPRQPAKATPRQPTPRQQSAQPEVTVHGLDDSGCMGGLANAWICFERGWDGFWFYACCSCLDMSDRELRQWGVRDPRNSRERTRPMPPAPPVASTMGGGGDAPMSPRAHASPRAQMSPRAQQERDLQLALAMEGGRTVRVDGQCVHASPPVTGVHWPPVQGAPVQAAVAPAAQPASLEWPEFVAPAKLPAPGPGDRGPFV